MTTEPAGQFSRGDATLAALSLAHVTTADDDVSGTWCPAPSPDGSCVAAISDRGGAPAVWLLAPAGAVHLDTGPHPVTHVTWSPDGAHLACTVAPGGAPRTEVWLVRPDGSDLRQVAGFGADTAIVAGWTDLGQLAVTEAGTTGRALLLRPADGARRILVEGDLLALLDVSPDGRSALLRRGPRGARHLELLDLPTGLSRALHDGDGCTDRGRFTADGRAVLARSDVGADLARLVSIPVTPQGEPWVVVAERADAELDDFAVTPEGTVALLWNVAGGRSDLVLRDRHGVERSVPVDAVVREPVFSADGNVLTVTAEGPASPSAVWTVVPAPITHGTVEARPAEQVTLTTFSPVLPELRRLRATDGLELTGWLYRPARHTGAAVISLHSGPEAQERPGYNPLFQSLAARGIAVFAPNVRGSSGFGRAFVNADNGPLRHAAIADVAACAVHLVESGVARADRIGCMGRSYGGYLTLAALVTYPSLFAVGVDVCGMADLATFYANTEPWIAAAAVSKYGHPERDRELLRELSPLHHLDRLGAPLLVVHGDNDTNVPTSEAERLVAALTERGMPHRFLRFPDEGHEFLGRANRETYVRATVAWLRHHLVPR